MLGKMMREIWNGARTPPKNTVRSFAKRLRKKQKDRHRLQSGSAEELSLSLLVVLGICLSSRSIEMVDAGSSFR